MADTFTDLDITTGVFTTNVALLEAPVIVYPTLGLGLSIPILTAIEGLHTAQRIGIILDQPVDCASVVPGNFGTDQGWILTGTAAQQTGSNQFAFSVSDVAPQLTSVVKSASGVTLDFHRNLGPGVVAPSGSGNAGWNTNGNTSKPAATSILVPLTDVPPVLQSLSGDATGLVATFNLPVNCGTPSFVQPVGAGWEFDESVAQSSPEAIFVGIDDVMTGGMSVVRITQGDRVIAIDFTDNVVLSAGGLDPANWIFGTVVPGAVPVSARTVTVDGKAVILTTTQFTGDKIYTLYPPTAEITSDLGDVYSGPAFFNFLAVGHNPAIIQTRVLDATHIDVIFNEDVTTETATDPNNYAFEPPLQVTDVNRLNDSAYRLVVVGWRPGQVYELTVSNIVDLANNPVVN